MPHADLHIGDERVPMFSVRHVRTGLWLNLGDDDAWRLDSTDGVSLHEFFDAPDVGSEGFAYDLLDWLRTMAGTGEVVGDRWVDIHPIDIEQAGVFRFNGPRPVMLTLPE